MSRAARHQLSGEDEKIVAGRAEVPSVQYCSRATEASRADTSFERRMLVGERDGVRYLVLEHPATVIGGARS